MKKATIILLLTTLLMSFTTGCSVNETLTELGYSSVSDAADDIIEQAMELAEEISIDDIKQQYVDSGLKDAVDDLVKAVENSYETYDYVVDTTSLEELYHGEDEAISMSVYTDASGKVYLIDYITNTTTVFSGDAATNFLNSYIEKASGIDLNNY